MSIDEAAKAILDSVKQPTPKVSIWRSVREKPNKSGLIIVLAYTRVEIMLWDAKTETMTKPNDSPVNYYTLDSFVYWTELP